MSEEKKPIEKDKIINEDENLQTEPELETEADEETESDSKQLTSADDEGDGGGSLPPPSKGRG